MRISRISVKNLGPISTLNKEFKNFNLIYGKNERGKSLIVEFIIKTIFKNTNESDWGHLRRLGEGNVVINGLDKFTDNGKSEITFNSENDKEIKLDVYLSEKGMNFPLDIAKLFIIKEGEASLVQNVEAGIDKEFIKKIFFPDKIFDQILNEKILETISNNEKKIDKEDLNNLKYDKKGKINNYEEILGKFKKIEATEEEIIKNYEKISEIELKQMQEELKTEKERIIKAKRYQAYKLSKNLKELEQKLSKLDKDNINKLESLIKDYDDKNKDLNNLNQQIEILKESEKEIESLKDTYDDLLYAKKCKAALIDKKIQDLNKELLDYSEDKLNELYNLLDKTSVGKSKLEKLERQKNELEEDIKNIDFLRSAKENYSKYLISSKNEKGFFSSSKSLIIFSILMIFSSFLAGFLTKNLFKIIFFASSLINFIFFLFSILKFLGKAKNQNIEKELEKIKQKFKEYFNINLESLTQLDELIRKTESKETKYNFIKEQYEIFSTDDVNNRKRINDIFKSLSYENLEEVKWNEVYSEIKAKRAKIQNEKDDFQKKFDRLNIEPFISTDNIIDCNSYANKYNEEEFEKVKDKMTKLESKLEELKDHKTNVKIKEDELKEILNRIKNIISNHFSEFINREIDNIENFGEIYGELIKLEKKIENEKSEAEGILKGLSVAEKDYEENDPGVEFSQERLDELENKIMEINEKIKQKETDEQELKNKLISLTNSGPGNDIEDLIEKLYQTKDQQKAKKIKAESIILASDLLKDIIKDFKNEEDTEIENILSSDKFKNILVKTTNKYKKLEFQNFEDGKRKKYSNNESSEIVILDDYNKFQIKDLSTGAKEQVLIALRIGILKYLLQDKTAFLILDDAFQHSDYFRRENLIDFITDLSFEGWQIFYFTMDDHIRAAIQSMIAKKKIDLFEINLENMS